MTRESKLKKAEELLEYMISDATDVYILMADLCGSTAFKERVAAQGLPEVIWISRQLFFLTRTAGYINRYEGSVVKTKGDEVMAVFSASAIPENVLKCAIEIVQGFDSYRLYNGLSKIEAKVSIDFGQTYNGAIADKKPYDPIGTPVDRCARLNLITKQREISFSQPFLESILASVPDAQLKERYGYQTRLENLKGLGETPIHSIIA
jgi:class 3 adenylate cyclase